jgi:hypothetical protein
VNLWQLQVLENASQITAVHILCHNRLGKVVPLSQTIVRLDRGLILGKGLARLKLPAPFRSNGDASIADRLS